CLESWKSLMPTRCLMMELAEPALAKRAVRPPDSNGAPCSLGCTRVPPGCYSQGAVVLSGLRRARVFVLCAAAAHAACSPLLKANDYTFAEAGKKDSSAGNLTPIGDATVSPFL